MKSSCWHSVKEKLPEQGEIVLLFRENWIYPIPVYLCYHEGTKRGSSPFSLMGYPMPIHEIEPHFYWQPCVDEPRERISEEDYWLEIPEIEGNERA